MKEEKKSVFKKIAEKFGVNPEPEAPPEPAAEPNQSLTSPEEITQPEVSISPEEIDEETKITPVNQEPEVTPEPPVLPAESTPEQPEIATPEPLSVEFAAPAEPAPEIVIEEPAPPKRPVTIIATHTVRPNETLSHIALRYYGHATPPYYRLIYEFNRNVIGNNMNLIIPGQVLRIPSLPEDFKK